MDQHVETAFRKVHDHIFQLLLFHLSVADADRGIRHQTLDLGSDPSDGFHSVVEDIHLPSPSDLLLDGFPDDEVILFHHISLDRIAILRRFLDGTHVLDPRKRHMQCPGDGRRGQGQHIHICPQLLDPLLVADAKALFLIDDEQSQIVEPDVL